MLALCPQILFWVSVSRLRSLKTLKFGLSEIVPILEVFYALSPDTHTLIKIWAHSANIPVNWLFKNTPHPYTKGFQFKKKINKISVTFEQIMQFWYPSWFRIPRMINDKCMIILETEETEEMRRDELLRQVILL